MGLQRAAVGFSPHSGWAAAVVLAGPVAKPEMIDRRRFILAEPDDHVGKQPFHAAESDAAGPATRLVDRCVADSRKRAKQSWSGWIGPGRRGLPDRGRRRARKEPRPLGALAGHPGVARPHPRGRGRECSGRSCATRRRTGRSRSRTCRSATRRPDAPRRWACPRRRCGPTWPRWAARPDRRGRRTRRVAALIAPGPASAKTTRG